MSKEWEEIYRKDGVLVGRWEQSAPGIAGSIGFDVADEKWSIRLRLSIEDGDAISPGLDMEWSPARPGELANFTYEIRTVCKPGEITISDSGTLIALGSGPAGFENANGFKTGFSVDLPANFVPAVRLAIEAAFAAAAGRKKERKERRRGA